MKATGKKPILIGVSEGAGQDAVLAATDPDTKAAVTGVIGARTSEPQRARLAVEGHANLPDARGTQ